MKSFITYALIVILAVHIFISLLITFFPSVSLGHSRVGRIYEYLVHLGPFYREESIQSTPHFTVLANGLGTDLVLDHMNKYRTNLWKINQLLLRDHVRRSADALLKAGPNAKSEAYKKLHTATARTRTDIQAGDSVTWIYFHRWYSAEKKTFHNDTLFRYRLRWHDQ